MEVGDFERGKVRFVCGDWRNVGFQTWKVAAAAAVSFDGFSSLMRLKKKTTWISSLEAFPSSNSQLRRKCRKVDLGLRFSSVTTDLGLRDFPPRLKGGYFSLITLAFFSPHSIRHRLAQPAFNTTGDIYCL